MDRKLPENPEIQRLIRLSHASRACLSSEAETLRHRLDFPSRIRGSLQEHPTAWLFGSLASGMAASVMFRRRPAAPRKRKGIYGALFGLTLTAARPLARLWLSDQIKQWSSGVYSGSRQNEARSNLQNPSSPAHAHSPGSGSR